jgi:peroxiredoxin
MVIVEVEDAIIMGSWKDGISNSGIALVSNGRTGDTFLMGTRPTVSDDGVRERSFPTFTLHHHVR